MLKDSGSRTEFETGAVRDIGAGRGEPSLLPMDALVELSKLFEEGNKKYGRYNYAKGIELNRYVDSAFRHMAAFMDGDTSEPHLVQWAWNSICCLAALLGIEKGKLPTSLVDKMPIRDFRLMGRQVLIGEDGWVTVQYDDGKDLKIEGPDAEKRKEVIDGRTNLHKNICDGISRSIDGGL